MKKLGKAIIILLVLAAIAGGAYYVYNYTDLIKGITASNDKVYVESVASITSQTTGSQNQFMGVVESQEVSNINADSSQTVDEVLVKVGDSVKEGDKLFTYDVSELQSSLDGLALDLEQYNAEISAYNTQIKEIETQRDKAAEKKTLTDSELLEYTTEIQAIQLSIQQQQNDIKSKELEIEKTKESIANAYVVSKIDGVVREINDPESAIYDSYDDSAAFIVIVAEGDYRIKGTINEQNVWTLSEGQPVIIRSRVDDTIWNGSISKIDTENPVQNNNEYSSSDSSTNYPFYVKLDQADGLLLGQHLYIELDQGQTEVKDGIWLNSSYLMIADDAELIEDASGNATAASAEIWIRNDNAKLEKRTVTLGKYDANMDTYEILSGLTSTDYIAVPMDYLYEGVACVTSEAEVDYTSPMYSEEDSYSDDSEDGEEYDDTYDDQDFSTEEESYDDEITLGDDSDTMSQAESDGLVDDDTYISEDGEETTTSTTTGFRSNGLIGR